MCVCYTFGSFARILYLHSHEKSHFFDGKNEVKFVSFIQIFRNE